MERALSSDRPPTYRRQPPGSSFDAIAPPVRQLLAATPTMLATVLAERAGWTGAASLFRAKVAMTRPEYVPPDPADRLVHEAGFQVECDLWFPEQPIPLGHHQDGKPPVLVMTSSFSGLIQARLLPIRATPGPAMRHVVAVAAVASGADPAVVGQRGRYLPGQNSPLPLTTLPKNAP